MNALTNVVLLRDPAARRMLDLLAGAKAAAAAARGRAEEHRQRADEILAADQFLTEADFARQGRNAAASLAGAHEVNRIAVANAEAEANREEETAAAMDQQALGLVEKLTALGVTP